MIIAAAILLTIGALVFTIAVRSKDLPPPEPVNPNQHLEDRKAQIYENLRDLQFEYRVGKLSDEDYQTTKLELQKELAGVLAQLDQSKVRVPAQAAAKPKAAPGVVCPHCNARFAKPMKFCGECGKSMEARA